MTSFSPTNIFPAAINHLLAQEAWARGKLIPHAGKIAVLDAGVLAARLKTLVQHGVLEPKLYSERPPRNEYVLTPKGLALSDVLIVMHGWGSQHLYGDADSGVSFTHKTCGAELKPRVACDCCGEIVKRRDTEIHFHANRPTVAEILPKEAATEDAA